MTDELWDRLIGQDRIAEYLRSASSDPSGSYLFVGPPGVGKLETAKVFAASVLCHEGCGVCGICTRVMQGLHPDVQSYGPEGYTFPVELIRQMVSAASRTPIEANRRLFIVEEADRIAERSQNALLKALEEPTHTVTWVLVADALEPFLPTILSRCQIVEFSPVPDASVLEIVQSRFELPLAEAEMIVRLTRGDTERAVELATSESARSVRTLALRATTRLDSPAWVFQIMDELGSITAALLDGVADEHKAQAAALEDSIGATKGSATLKKRLTDRHKRELRRAQTDVLKDFLMWLGVVFRDLGGLAAGAVPESIINVDAAGDLVHTAALRSPGFWLEMVDGCLDGQLSISENANPDMVVESVLLVSLVSGPREALIL